MSLNVSENQSFGMIFV